MVLSEVCGFELLGWCALMPSCRYDLSKDCFHNGVCSIFDVASGNVSLCPLFEGRPMFSSRKVAPVHVSLFSKHLRRK